MSVKYLLDSDVFIASHAVQYGMEFCPAFWDWLEEANKGGTVFSIDKICDELRVKSDKVCEWAQQRGDRFFVPFDDLAKLKLREVAAWPHTQARYREAAIAEFLKSGDLYLISYALAHGYTVVTNEVSEPGSKKSVKIPDVCLALGVKYISLWRLLRTEKPMMVLRRKDHASTIDTIRH